MDSLVDIQKSSNDFPYLPIEKVGVENIKVQLPIRTKDNSVQYVMASIKSYCSLVENIKGIHMSRIGQTIYRVIEEKGQDGFVDLEVFAEELLRAHGSESVFISADFDYQLYQETPVTKLYSPRTINVKMTTEIVNGKTHNYLTIKTIEMSLCPCSKEMSLLKNVLDEGEIKELSKLSDEVKNKVLMSGFGAHNQKSEILTTVELIDSQCFTIEALAHIITCCVSAPTYSILKRPDEKRITEIAYLGGYWEEGEFKKIGGGPKFVEDIVREVGMKMNEKLDIDICDYLIYIRNYESIHSENIIASSIMSANRELKSIF